MAQSDLGKYSVTSPRFNLADKHFRASTDREEYGSSRASKIKDSPGRSGGPATRKVLGEAGTGAEASYPRYEVPTGVEAGDQEIPTGANVPQDIESQRVSTPEMTTERQGAITDRARGPYYVPGSPLDNILGHISEAQPNTAFDPDKPVGGENVPYQPTKGISGWFQRFGGNRANEQNIEAQLAQGAEWKQDAKAEKERANKMTDRLAEIEALDKGPAARFAATEKRLADKAINDEIERNNAIDLGLLKEGNEAVFKDVDMVRKEAADAAKQTLEERRVKLAEDAYNNPSYQAVHDPKGNVLFYNTKTGRPTGTYRQSNFGMITDPNDPKKQIMGTVPGGYEAIGPSGSTNEPQVTGFGDSYVNGLDASGNKFGKLPPPKPAAAVTPARSAAPGEQGEEVRGLIPSIGDYLSSGEAASMGQEAPATAQSREGFMAGLGDVGNFVSEGARAIKPLMLGGRLPRYTPEQGGGVLGMMLNAPGAVMTPVEYGLNTVLRNPMRAMQGVDSSTSLAEPSRMQDPKTMYMGDQEYKNYLRSKRLPN
jgi:hypothetical protein